MNNKKVANELMKIARSLVAVMPRDYYKGCEAEIASEVVMMGKSRGWASYDEEDLVTAKEVEEHLSKFNIGYTDDMRGEWEYVRGGTKHFRK